jgi:glycosyltransferase involved in cell wall biosynthesis
VRRLAVSVLIPTRDRTELLADALRSVAAQRTPPLEVRIADDGDVPATAACDGRGLLEVVVLPCAARRLAAARNLAAHAARGEVLAFLDDDDRWRPDHLDRLGAAFDDPRVELAYTDSVVVRERIEPGGRRVGLAERILARDWDPEWMAHDDYVPPSSWAVRRGLFERLGGFDESFAFSEDWDFLLRAGVLTRPHRVPGVTVEVRLREHGNLSSDTGPERRECLDRLSLRHGLPPLAIRTFWEVAERSGAAP